MSSLDTSALVDELREVVVSVLLHVVNARIIYKKRGEFENDEAKKN